MGWDGRRWDGMGWDGMQEHYLSGFSAHYSVIQCKDLCDNYFLFYPLFSLFVFCIHFLSVLYSCRALHAMQWYENAFDDITIPITPNYNLSSPDKPQHIRQNPPFTDQVTCWENQHFRDRWATLLSVDEIVDAVVTKLTDLKILDKVTELRSIRYHLACTRTTHISLYVSYLHVSECM